MSTRWTVLRISAQWHDVGRRIGFAKPTLSGTIFSVHCLKLAIRSNRGQPLLSLFQEAVSQLPEICIQPPSS